MTPKHQKITTYSKNDDGSVSIEQESYYEKLAQVIQEIEKPTLATSDTIKEEVTRALDHVLLEGSPKLVLTIERKTGKDIRLTKRYVKFKQQYGRM
jgi:hypothetical protein